MDDDEAGLSEHLATRHGEIQGAVEPKKISVRFATINQFVDLHLATCDPSEASVYLTIWRFVRDGKTEIGHKQLAAITGINERSSKRAVAKLIAKGIIKRVRQGNNLMNKTNLYEIPLQRGAKGDPLQTNLIVGHQWHPDEINTRNLKQ